MKKNLTVVLFLIFFCLSCKTEPSSDSIGYDELITIKAYDENNKIIGRIYFEYDYTGKYSLTTSEPAIVSGVSLNVRGVLDDDLTNFSYKISNSNDRLKQFCLEVLVFRTSFEFEDKSHIVCFDSLKDNDDMSSIFRIIDQAFDEGTPITKEQQDIKESYSWTLPSKWFDI